jgi:N-acetylglucosamine-6-phosphate deacetylase
LLWASPICPVTDAVDANGSPMIEFSLRGAKVQVLRLDTAVAVAPTAGHAGEFAKHLGFLSLTVVRER